MYYFQCRSYKVPLGFDRKDPKTAAGNAAAFGCFIVCLVAVRCKVPALIEQPRLSKMRWLSFWRWALTLPGVTESWLASCAYGAKYRKEFVLLGHLLNLPLIHKKCPGNHVHPRIEGSLTKESAIYRPKVAAAFARVIARALLKETSQPPPPRAGLESVIVNDILQSPGWCTVAVWSWRAAAHINVLETKAALRTIQHAVLKGGDRKVVLCLDSSVARGELAKGRTTSKLLRPVLCKAAAWLVAGGVYLGMHHAPTRLNISDDPTRSKGLRAPAKHSLASLLPREAIPLLLPFCSLSSAASGWLRLSLLLASRVQEDRGLDLPVALGSPFRRTLPLPAPLSPAPCGRRPASPRDRFDSSLGYPGEGPRLAPRNALDLLEAFDAWLRNKQLSVAAVVSSGTDVEELVKLLNDYGRELFSAGYPYYHFSETINGIAAKRPTARRQLQGAWDLTFAWLSTEPSSHHVAMPAVVLLALLSVCLLWGWRAEARLAFGGLLRIGEAIQATRSCLVLPRDVLFLHQFILLRILEPKTRLRAARHQAAKIEAADLVQLIDIAFAHLPPSSRLWPHSAQTLRRRLDSALDRLGIPTARNHARPLDLGSFRPGGATHILQLTEDAEFVRRRGRWVSAKVMEIYLQEIAAVTFYPNLPVQVREKVMIYAQSFPGILEQSLAWTRNRIPTSAWYHLWSSNSATCNGVNTGVSGEVSFFALVSTAGAPPSGHGQPHGCGFLWLVASGSKPFACRQKMILGALDNKSDLVNDDCSCSAARPPSRLTHGVRFLSLQLAAREHCWSTSQWSRAASWMRNLMASCKWIEALCVQAENDLGSSYIIPLGF